MNKRPKWNVVQLSCEDRSVFHLRVAYLRKSKNTSNVIVAAISFFDFFYRHSSGVCPFLICA